MTIENEKLGISFEVIGIEGFNDWIVQHDKKVIDECKDALLLAITESYIWSEVAEAVKDKEIQMHTDNIYDDVEKTIISVLERLKEQKNE